MKAVECVACGSDNVQPQAGVEDIYRCNDCDEFFEDENFELEFLREHKVKQTVKQMLSQ